jgi:hypothetical protein
MDLIPPQEGDAWLMGELFCMQFDKDELARLNRVRLHQQAFFLSDILDARGTAIGRKYLQWRPRSKQFSPITFPLEEPLVRDFKLWECAIFRFGVGCRGQGRMQGFKQPGHIIWHWQFDAETDTLYHLKSRDKMDVYAPSVIPGLVDRRNCWSLSYQAVPLVEQGDYCMTQEVALAVIAIILRTPAATQARRHNNIWDVLQSWGYCWIWENLRMVGKDDWIKEAIEAGLCLANTDRSYIKQVHPELCANAFIMECSRGCGRMIGSFAEASSAANVYRGELFGLMQVHLILLAVQRTTPALKSKPVIYSDCLGDLGWVSLLPPGRISTRCRHSDVLKNILVNCEDFTCQ